MSVFTTATSFHSWAVLSLTWVLLLQKCLGLMPLVGESSEGSLSLNGRLVLLNQSFFFLVQNCPTVLSHAGTFKSAESISLHKDCASGTSALSSDVAGSMVPHPTTELPFSSPPPLPAYHSHLQTTPSALFPLAYWNPYWTQNREKHVSF